MAARENLVIKHGTVVDGSGRPPFEADVVVRGDRIASVGRFDGTADEVIEARGKLVTPGFIDIHTHLDAQLAWDPLATPSCWHGVTSVIVGNCGVGFAPCRPADRDYLMFLMEGVEDIPQKALAAGMPWQWESFAEYLDFLARRPLGLNVGAHVAHAPLRVYAMGERGASDAAPSDTELACMRDSVQQAMMAGALGLSTGRTTMHRTPAGDPVPGTFAAWRELEAITAPLAECGAGVIQLVPLGGAGEAIDGFAQDMAWMEPLSKSTGRPVSVGLVQPRNYPAQWREALAAVARANGAGARIVPQVAPKSVGLLLGMGMLSPLFLFPAASELFDKPLDEVRERLRDAALRQRLIESFAADNGEILAGLASLDTVIPLHDLGVRAYEVRRERSITGLAEARAESPGKVILDHLLATDWRGMFLVPVYNPDLEAAGTMLADNLTLPGLGDAGAHTSQTCDASSATFILAYWVRDRGRMSIETAVRKLTFDPALLWGIRARGLIRRGWYADLNIIDLDRLDLLLPELRHEFPTGAAHLSQQARGYVATIVNGRVLMRDGAHAGPYPGRVLRNEIAGG